MNSRSLFVPDGDGFIPSVDTRGPWDDNAQHGGAPGALVAYLAERDESPEYRLTRITMELLRPVPIERLSAKVEAADGGRTVHRRLITLHAGDKPVVRALAISVRVSNTELPCAGSADCSMPARGSGSPFRIKGMPENKAFFGSSAMETEVVDGSVTEPGPASVWFRLKLPVVDGADNSPAMRAMAAADFPNGISWELPFGDYTFVNYDLTVYLHRPPRGEWVGVDAHSQIPADGLGLSQGGLFDEQGSVGTAQQGLVVRKNG